MQIGTKVMAASSRQLKAWIWQNRAAAKRNNNNNIVTGANTKQLQANKKNMKNKKILKIKINRNGRDQRV